MYTFYREAEASLERLAYRGNYVASKLLVALRERFSTTASLTLAHLAYILTPSGLKTFQALPNDREKRTTKRVLKEKFLEITNVLDIDGLGEAGVFLPALLDNYISFWNVNEGEDPHAFWNERIDETIVLPQANGGNPISLSVFATVALILISLPASEAMVERAFSQVKAIGTSFNKSMSNDLFLSLATIKLCLRYRNKYFFLKEDE